MQWRTEQRVRLHSAACLQVQITIGISTDYISNRRLLMSLADAGGRLMYAYKDLLELAGLTTRLYTLLSTLHHLKPLPEFVRSPETVEFKNVVVGIPKRDAELGEAPLVNTKTGGERGGEVYDFAESLLEGTGISEDRPLVSGLSVRIERGEHLMISGPVCAS